MDKQRTLFYGFIIGVILMVLPLPKFFFWEDVLDVVNILFDYSGFFLFVICGFPLINNVLRHLISNQT
ncbi:hypothetical protein [Caldalkalibacillus salinus]|uniref:hypothetical protein n=1 Tax=Caldalkalibacillus salinus TaxID=2803787 RepID=UPI0019226630|nr:hypothetical protein [Caldalkalibacillus salinus]